MNTADQESKGLGRALDFAARAWDGALSENGAGALQAREIGTILSVGEGVVELSGLPGACSEELVRFPGGGMGMAFNLDPGRVGVVLLDRGESLKAGMEARRAGRALDVPVGEGLLGRVVDALGRPLDGKGPVRSEGRLPAERDAPGVMERAGVSAPLQTGIKIVDALVPIGRGQRELILGDRQTGKTSLALDAIINQAGKGVACVYCAIGQRGSGTAKAIDALRASGALDYTAVVVAGGEDAPGLQFAAPYAAASMGEFFRDRGDDALVVFDDLTRHARAYRELSLLLERPPGREAYPGDIFYVHSRLLERSTRLRPDLGGGSLTALPIVETQAQNLSAYIPTNLISITDGQIYLDPDLFQKGVLPAVHAGKSVSRVGGKARLAAFNQVAGDLRLSYAQFEEMERFARFSSTIDEETRHVLERGRRVREILKQSERRPMPAGEQVAVLLAVSGGAFDAVPPDSIGEAEALLRARVRESLPQAAERIEAGERLSDADRGALLEAARETARPFEEKLEASLAKGDESSAEKSAPSPGKA